MIFPAKKGVLTLEKSSAGTPFNFSPDSINN